MKKFSFNSFFDFEQGVHFVRPMILSIGVGVGTGFLVVGFIKSLDFATEVFFKIPQGHSHFWIILIPVLGGLMVGPLITFFAPEAKGHGVPEVLKSIVLKGGRIRPVVVIVKVFASILSIGSGFSIGREGPIVQIGSGFGSICGQVLKLSESRIKNLVACGAAAGIAGVFNTPIAGVIFASEVILRDFGANALSTVVVAAVSSSIISRIFLGNHPSFVVPSYHLQSPYEIFLYFVLGVLSAFAAVIFVKTLEFFERWFEKWKFADWLKPAAGGLIIGCIGWGYPEIFGSGLSTIESALHGNLALQTLLVLIVLKIFATSISLGSGSSGGVFAPLLFIGAVLGGSMGNVISNYHGGNFAPSGAYALVGMASVFAAAAHAPITAILIVFEMTGGYSMILPIMVAAIVATSLSQRMLRDSVYLRRLKQKGIDITSFEEVQIMGGLTVSDAMTADFTIISTEMSAQEIISTIAKEKKKSVFVIDSKDKLLGTLKLLELNKILSMGPEATFKIQELIIPISEYSFSDEPLIEAARVMGLTHLHEVPVVDSLDAKKVVGVLRADDVFRVYAENIDKQNEVTDQIEHEAIIPIEMKTVSFNVTVRSALAGKKIHELMLPEGVHFNAIKRNDNYIIPHGNIILNLKDRVSATVMPKNIEDFRKWLRTNRLKDF